MRLHHEELTFFVFLLLLRWWMPEPERVPAGHTGTRAGSSCQAEVGAPDPSHIPKLLKPLDAEPKTHSGEPAPFLTRGTLPMGSAEPAPRRANKKQKLLVTSAVKFLEITLFKRHSWNILFPFVCCKMCSLYKCAHTNTHTHTEAPSRDRTLP